MAQRDQEAQLQRDALTAAGCSRIFEDMESGKNTAGRSCGQHSTTPAPATPVCVEARSLQVVGAMAEFERSLIKERTRAGLDAAKAQGRTAEDVRPS